MVLLLERLPGLQLQLQDRRLSQSRRPVQHLLRGVDKVDETSGVVRRFGA